MDSVIRGIVIQQKDNKENDLLLSVLTNDGVKNVLARGVKKYGAKNKALCQMYVYGEFEVMQVSENARYVLKSGNIIKNNQAISDNLYAIGILTFCNEVIVRNFSNEEIFNTYNELLDSFSTSDNYYFYFAWLVSSWIKISGVTPIVDKCSSCFNNTVVGISLDGGFVCQKCFGKYDLHYNVEQLKLFRYLFKADLSNKDKLKDFAYDWALVELLVKYYLYHQPGEYKSWKFLNELMSGA